MESHNLSASDGENTNVLDEEFVNQIRGLAKSLQKMLQDNLHLIKSDVNVLLEQQEKDGNKIAWVLDHLLDYTRHGVGDDVFFRLVAYYRTIDKEAAADYMRYYEEEKE